MHRTFFSVFLACFFRQRAHRLPGLFSPCNRSSSSVSESPFLPATYRSLCLRTLSSHDAGHSRHQPGLRCPELVQRGHLAQRMARAVPFLPCSPPGAELVSRPPEHFHAPSWLPRHPHLLEAEVTHFTEEKVNFGVLRDPQPAQLESIEALLETQI